MNTNEYMKDAKGRLVAKSMVKDIDLARDEFVRECIMKSKAVQAAMAEFKRSMHADFNAFLEMSAERYGVDLGGRKGNVTLTTFDGTQRIQIQVSDCIDFTEGLQAAKVLVDECVKEWTADARAEIKTLIDGAFDTDKQGKINTQRVLALRSLKIDHPKWLRAMEALSDSITVVGSRSYIRLYERPTPDDEYQHIHLDIAKL